MEKIVWELFQKTGKINYCLLANQIRKSDKNEDSGCQGIDTK